MDRQRCKQHHTSVWKLVGSECGTCSEVQAAKDLSRRNTQCYLAAGTDKCDMLCYLYCGNHTLFGDAINHDRLHIDCSHPEKRLHGVSTATRHPALSGEEVWCDESEEEQRDIEGTMIYSHGSGFKRPSSTRAPGQEHRKPALPHS
ncbi:hypothetical protein MHYP_G00331190 [Metynnis hypsauchen]